MSDSIPGIGNQPGRQQPQNPQGDKKKQPRKSKANHKPIHDAVDLHSEPREVSGPAYPHMPWQKTRPGLLKGPDCAVTENF